MEWSASILKQEKNTRQKSRDGKKLEENVINYRRFSPFYFNYTSLENTFERGVFCGFCVFFCFFFGLKKVVGYQVPKRMQFYYALKRISAYTDPAVFIHSEYTVQNRPH